jgi:hypothetical protein
VGNGYNFAPAYGMLLRERKRAGLRVYGVKAKIMRGSGASAYQVSEGTPVKDYALAVRMTNEFQRIVDGKYADDDDDEAALPVSIYDFPVVGAIFKAEERRRKLLDFMSENGQIVSVEQNATNRRVVPNPNGKKK